MGSFVSSVLGAMFRFSGVSGSWMTDDAVECVIANGYNVLLVGHPMTHNQLRRALSRNEPANGPLRKAMTTPEIGTCPVSMARGLPGVADWFWVPGFRDEVIESLSSLEAGLAWGLSMADANPGSSLDDILALGLGLERADAAQ